MLSNNIPLVQCLFADAEASTHQEGPQLMSTWGPFSLVHTYSIRKNILLHKKKHCPIVVSQSLLITVVTQYFLCHNECHKCAVRQVCSYSGVSSASTNTRLDYSCHAQFFHANIFLKYVPGGKRS